MNFDWQKVSENKAAHRRKLAAKPIAEKLRLLDALHERAVAIRTARFREASTVQEKPGRYGGRKGTTS